MFLTFYISSRTRSGPDQWLFIHDYTYHVKYNRINCLASGVFEAILQFWSDFTKRLGNKDLRENLRH